MAQAQTACDPNPAITSISVSPSKLQVPKGALSVLGEVRVVIDPNGHCPTPNPFVGLTLTREVVASHDGALRQETFTPKASKAVNSCPGCREYLYDVRFWSGQNQITATVANTAGSASQITQTAVSLNATPGFYASADPPLVSPMGGTVLLSATSFDASGRPIAGQKIEWLQYGQITQVSQTNAQGATYLLAQCRPQNAQDCGFSARPVGQNLTPIPVQVAQFQVETLPQTGLPVQGIVTDKLQHVQIDLQAMPNSALKCPQPAFGRYLLKQKQAFVPLPKATIEADQKGHIEFYYEPPEEIATSAFTGKIPTIAGPVAVVPQSLRFELETPGSLPIRLETPMNLVRPTVALLPEFYDEPQLLTPLQHALHQQQYRTIGETELKAQGMRYTAKEQTQAIQGILANEQNLLAAAGVKADRMDAVAFGIAGLLARNAIAQNAQNPPIRKLIMIGTPNHGLNLQSQLSPPDPSYWAALHPGLVRGNPPLAYTDLLAGSEFLNALNAQESKGGHLHPQVEYALLLGERRTRSQVLPFAEDDGLVYHASAHLSGVQQEIIKGLHHLAAFDNQSGFLDSQYFGQSGQLHEKVISLLQSPIARPKPESFSLQIAYQRGQVSLGAQSPKAVQATPQKIAHFDVISTSENGNALIEIAHRNKVVASLLLGPETRVQLLYSSPRRTLLRLHWGSLHVMELAAKGGQVTVEIPESRESYYPKARFISAKSQSDFIVTATTSSPAIFVQKGSVAAFASGNVEPQLLKEDQSQRLHQSRFEEAVPPDDLLTRFRIKNLAPLESPDGASSSQAQPSQDKSALLCDYIARLSDEDHFNAKGAKLTSATAILLRDRVNNSAQRGDPEDQQDSYLSTPQARNFFAQMLKEQPLSETLQRSILQGTPLLRIQLYGDRYNITILSGEVADPQKPARGPKKPPKRPRR